MQKGWLRLPFLCLLLCCCSVTVVAGQPDWSEEKVGRLAVKADRAATQKNWTKAIRYGEEMLEGASALYGETDEDYLNRLKTLNRYYDKAGRLLEVSDQVIKAYQLSKTSLGPRHHISELSRLLYYKLLIAKKDYSAAVVVVQENIALLSDSEDDKFKRLHYMEQLFSLYGLLQQRSLEEQTLLEMLDLSKELMGPDSAENMPIILNLANSYCRQNKVEAFNALMKLYDLKYTCPFY
ncbi:hypothetical protein [Kordiimonas pumila]|uniref:Uncharacterized protein n=1 Tax=Kordiimonas pumila TaxID=2161677 RepID=A0ABV7D0K7_9PROT|nr:hypothetical protein [Kordiimonas pumila]